MRLSFLIPLLLILSALISSSLLFWQEMRVANRSIEQAGIDNINTTLTHLQNVLDTQLAADNPEDAKLSLSVTALHPGIRTLMLSDEKDTVILANHYLWEGSQASHVSGYDDENAHKVRQNRSSSISFSSQRSLLSGYYPITLRIAAGGLGIDRVGVLFVEYDLSPQLAQARHNSVIQAFSFGGVIIAISIAVAVLLYLLVSRRVELIVETSKRFAAGDLDARVLLHGHDELAELGNAFDDMASQRKATEDTIRTLNQELEQRVKERTTQLEAANKELESFSYSVSHDLRSPLRAVDGFTQILGEDYADKLDDEGKRVIGVVRDNAKKMGQLIDNILAFSRVGRKEMEMSEINMVDLAHSVFEELKPSMDGRSVQLDMKPLAACQGDRAMMHQVLVNLFSNAIKFTHNKQVAIIEVGCHAEDKENIYFVKDNGAGFDMQYAQKLFGIFQRLHGSEEFEGTGVGLSIVKRIVDKHGGRVWAEGKVNEGATFYFALPNK